MLAQNFKTADELGLTEQELEALKKTLVLMETEKLKHVDHYIIDHRISTEFTGHFAMSDWACAADCGTVACIGGTAELVGKLPFGSLDKKSKEISALRKLFYPHELIDLWSRITCERAACALRTYLTNGEADWGGT